MTIKEAIVKAYLELLEEQPVRTKQLGGEARFNEKSEKSPDFQGGEESGACLAV